MPSKHIALLILLSGCNPGGRSADRPSNRDGGSSQPDMAQCVGLRCFVEPCEGTTQTTVTGKVTAPNGLDPVNEAMVYVPTELTNFEPGVHCELCSDPTGGVLLTQATTAIDGTFVLSGVPATTHVPITVQKGRFRRTTYLDVTACQDNPLPPEQGRLPGKKADGDLPSMAVAIGAYDQIECVLHSIGIDAAEFTAPTGTGSVHLYDNDNGSNFPDFKTLLLDATKMKTYNLIFINCTSSQLETNYSAAERATAMANIQDYVASGGRLYVTDWSYDYMEQVPQFAPYVYFDGGGDEMTPQPLSDAFWVWSGEDIPGALVADDELKEWLKATGSSPNGQVTIKASWALALSAAADQATYPSHLWVHGTVSTDGHPNVDRPMTLTFDYNNCGKVLWSSYHTKSNEGAGGSSFPSYCATTATNMLPQEKILEFLIFQISACVNPIG